MATFTGTFDDDKPKTASQACMPSDDRQRARAVLSACVFLGLGFLLTREATGQTAYNHPTGAFDGWVASGGVQIITGYFNHDHLTDIGLVRREPGWNTVPVALSTGKGFDIQNWPAGVDVRKPEGGEFARDWATARGVQVITGDFDANGFTDIGLVRREPGWNTIPVALSNGTGFEIKNQPAHDGGDFARDFATTAGVQVITGDFNASQGTDIALIRQTPGWSTVPVARLRTRDFGIRNDPANQLGLEFADFATAGGVRIVTGDFDGDGLTDLGLVRQTTGTGWTTVPIARLTDTGILVQNRDAGEFADFAAMPGVQVVTGNFNRDDRLTDIALVQVGGLPPPVTPGGPPGRSAVPVLLSTDTGFILPPHDRGVGEFALWATVGGVQVITGYFNRDDLTDIALVRRTGAWTTVPVALSTDTGFTIQNREAPEFARWAREDGVQVITGTFNDDTLTDIALVKQTPGWTDVRLALSSDTGFTSRRWSVNRPGLQFAQWAASSGVRQHRFQVSRFGSANIFDAEVDDILADASTVLQMNDPPFADAPPVNPGDPPQPGDVPCNVTFSRDGDVIPFAGPGTITTQADEDAYLMMPGHVKVVDQISNCKGFVGPVSGCGPGSSFAVVRLPPSQRALEGILWAHEFGHVQLTRSGEDHRDDIANALMTGKGIHPGSKKINEAECKAFKKPSAANLLAQTVLAQTVLVRPAMAQRRESGLMDISDFVRQVFIHGVPYEEASRYDSSVVLRLLEMLNDPAEEAHWPNIVVVLGMIGDERAVDPLISFIEADLSGEVSSQRYRAKTAALMALGYLINKTGNRKALAYLTQSIRPQTWEARDVVGIAPFQADVAERNTDFSKHAILGLALSGHPEAAPALRSLQQPAPTETQRVFQAEAGDLVSEALEEHAKIAREGLASYYRETPP